MISTISRLGVGLGYRELLDKKIFDNRDKIDFLEIVTEAFFHGVRSIEKLSRLRDNFLVVPHGVCLSIGSPKVDMEHLRSVKKICDILKSQYYSDHLCITKIPGLSTGHLTPLWYTQKNLKIVIDNVRFVQDYLQLPLVLENISYHFTLPNAELTFSEFVSFLVEETGCGILLDLANVTVNTHNHGYDPFVFIENIPIDKVVQVHLAGGVIKKDGYLVDSHNREVSEKTWLLLEYLAKKIEIKAVLLEHDSDFPNDFLFFSKQLEHARSILNACKKYKADKLLQDIPCQIESALC